MSVKEAGVRERSALAQMLAIAAPSVVTMTSYSAMQFADRLMVKEIGPETWYVAAQGAAGIITWTAMTFCVGLTGVVSSFVSQNLGAGKPERGSAYAWNAVWVGLVYWAVLMLPLTALTPWIFQHVPAGAEEEVHRLAKEYALVSFAGSLFTLMAKGMHNYFFGLHRPGVVLVSVVLGNVTNVFFNAVLIFGSAGLTMGERWAGPAGLVHDGLSVVFGGAAWLAGTLGIPAMGLAGAALATVLGTVIEFGVPMAVFLGPKLNKAYRTRAAWRPDLTCFKDLWRIGWPAGAMFLNDLLTWQYMMTVLTPRGAARAAELAGGDPKAAATAATSAGFIALQWMHLSFMPAVGVSIATQAMVGKAVGARDPDAAARHAWLGLKLAMGYMGACAVVFVLAAPGLIGVFVNAQTPEAVTALIVALGVKIMFAAAVFQVFDALAITMSAALRGAGDTIWPGVAAVVTSWTCIVIGGEVLLRAMPGLGGLSAWIGASGYIIALGVALLVRFLRGKWRTMRLVHDDPVHNLPPDEVLPPGPNPAAG
jgi:MATE family multidrug resistance protein